MCSILPDNGDSGDTHVRPNRDVELDLLADAADHGHDVHITYSDRNGTISHRTVTPDQALQRSLIARRHLRNGEREFTVENILEVAPAMEWFRAY